MNYEPTYHLENTTSKITSYQQPFNAIQPSMTTTSYQQPAIISNMNNFVPAFVPSAPSARASPKNETDSRVRVVVRLRPPIAEDAACSYGEFQDCTLLSKDQKSISLRKQAYEDREFQFDKVLGADATQAEMYQVVQPIVQDVLQGYNGTILAYGQTGTGKTYTVFGPGTHWELDMKKNKQAVDSNAFVYGQDGSFYPHHQSGLIPRAVHNIFSHIYQNKERTEFRVTVSFLQIYMENIMDLLDAAKNNLNIREDPKLGIFVDNLTTVAVQEPQDIIQIIKEGSQNRAVGSTNMNKVSTRSHVILSITLEQRPYEEIETADGKNREHNYVKRGTLTIVDLAGSERVSKSGSQGQKLQEAKKINKSLSALGNCVAALIDENTTFVPFRDSKLTRLLTDSLGGNSKTCLVATVGPSSFNYDESYSTLLFATRAMAVKNHAVINVEVDFKTLSGNLQRKIATIESEKFRLIARNVDLEKEVANLRNELKEMKHVGTTAAAFGGLKPAQWEAQIKRFEEREKELVAKFTNVIQHLQMEIAKQNAMHSAMKSAGSDDGDMIVDQLVNSMLNIPAVKQKIVARLLPDLQTSLLASLATAPSPRLDVPTSPTKSSRGSPPTLPGISNMQRQ